MTETKVERNMAAFLRILWIDDEVGNDDPAVCFLATEGIGVDCAVSGRHGVMAACGSDYDAIVLDLSLPDMDGVEVLDRLAAAQVTTPILVLTGRGDVERAVQVMKLGASDYRTKPLIRNELVGAITSVTLGRHGLMRAFGWDREIPNLQKGLNLDSIQRRLLLSGTPLEFIKTSTLFREVLEGDKAHPPYVACEEGFDANAVPERDIERVIAALDRELATGEIRDEAAAAEALGMRPGDLGKFCLKNLHLRFREARRLLRLRPAVRCLLRTGEQIAQIAYRVGYNHPAQFDRDFQTAFGTSPSAFRRQWLAARDSREPKR